MFTTNMESMSVYILASYTFQNTKNMYVVLILINFICMCTLSRLACMFKYNTIKAHFEFFELRDRRSPGDHCRWSQVFLFASIREGCRISVKKVTSINFIISRTHYFNNILIYFTSSDSESDGNRR